MNSMPLAILGLGAFIVLAGLVAVYLSVRRAPMGFEDGAGFHVERTEFAPIRPTTVSNARRLSLPDEAAKRASA